MEQTGKLLIVAGLVLIFTGILFWASGKLPEGYRPGSLPLDIKIVRENFSFYIPLGTSLLLSLLATLVFALFNR